MGEVWFYPRAGLHLTNVRALTVPNGPTGRITVALAYGDNHYLDADGRVPKVQPPKQETPRSEEVEDPPGEWTTPSSIEVGDALPVEVMALRTAYLWGRAGNGVWARLYAKVNIFWSLCM